LIGPTAGGGIYQHFGWRGPFIFGIVGTLIDFVGRLLVIERTDALVYGYDPAAAKSTSDNDAEAQLETRQIDAAPAVTSAEQPQAGGSGAPEQPKEKIQQKPEAPPEEEPHVAQQSASPATKEKPISLIHVLNRLKGDPRAMTATIMTFSWG
jgi:MFS transporter, DHA1 family, solute carrier family 18 (vesicular amine transporter), member 1/2